MSIIDVNILSKFRGLPVNSTEDIVKSLFWLCTAPEPGLNYLEFASQKQIQINGIYHLQPPKHPNVTIAKTSFPVSQRTPVLVSHVHIFPTGDARLDVRNR